MITFYSYKGGTGRTMALANTAALLAKRGARVLAVDWDLEAPGLDRFLRRDAAATSDDEPGVLELFSQLRSDLQAGPPPEDDSAYWKERIEEFAKASKFQRVWFMCAGRMDATYPERVARLNWEYIHERWPYAFQSLADATAGLFDYVLVDSRTGVTDASGICTMILPERLVVVFTPNRQSFTGVIELVERATAYRRGSGDLRPLTVYPLASRVELSEDDLRQRWRNGDRELQFDGYQPRFESLFKKVYDLPACDLTGYFDEVQIQQSTRYAYGERVAVEEETASDRLSLARSYTSFVNALAGDGPPWATRAELPAAEIPDEAVADVLDRLEQERAWHLDRATTLRRRQLQLLGGAGIVLLVSGALAYFVYEDVNSNSWPVMLVVGVLVAGLVVWASQTITSPKRRAVHARAAFQLDRERRQYRDRIGPYAATAAPSATLAERLDAILANAEDELLSLGALPRETQR